MREVMREVDQETEACEEQHEGARDGESGKPGGSVSAGDTDGVEPGRAVGERRDERAEHDLVRPIPEKLRSRRGGN
jgi:hypothetical protein